jgi:hypothetical protein
MLSRGKVHWSCQESNDDSSVVQPEAYQINGSGCGGGYHDHYDNDDDFDYGNDDDDLPRWCSHSAVMKNNILWDTALCPLVICHRRFEAAPQKNKLKTNILYTSGILNCG